ncbi:MAG TPA: ATP-binding protein [Chondromyces sp.]|nr:ATP-binding protein [Chondromyces sp.]
MIIQQEELNNQKERLQDALEKAKENEELLIRRNQFINGLINTLDKQELLENIIDSMVHFTKATKGIIALLDENKSVAYHGLAEREVKQFRQTISGSDIVAKLKRTLRPFVIKRDSLAAERGYVTDPYFCCDLILPIFLTDNQLVAVVMVTRVGHEFTEKEIGGFLGFCKQISLSLEKLFMYEETENNRQMVQDILNTVHEGIQLVNEKGRILLINDKLRDMIREEYRPLLQQPSYEWLEVLKEKAEEPEPLISFIKDAMNEKHEEPLIFKLKTDKKQIIQLHAETLYRDKKKFGTIFEYRDITKQYEVDQMKSEFVSTVSHELRTPLSSVLGFTELMLNKELPPQKQRKYLLTISQEATRLTALINDFLDVQRMESGKQTYDKNYCSIKSIIEDVLVIQKVNTAQHDFVVDIQTTNLTVLGDRDKLKQVFSNLLSNAVKYSPDGGNIIIRIREEQARLNIDIVDEGLGIPSEAIPDLFTKFYRIDNTDRRKIGGTGLGLAIVKEIVKAHDGEISVQSKLGKGSTFTVSLPLVSGIGMITRKDSLDESQYRPHIVIIEDDFNLANLLKDELEDNGFYTTHYADGETAVSAVIKNLPDVVVVDLKPEDSIDGWSIIKRLKDNPNTENIPIFISTVLDEREKGNLLGISGYLTKPYQPSRLSNSILQCLLENERKGQIMVPETDRNKNE